MEEIDLTHAPFTRTLVINYIRGEYKEHSNYMQEEDILREYLYLKENNMLHRLLDAELLSNGVYV